MLVALDPASTRIAELETALAAERDRAAAATAERDRFRAAYQQIKLELELLRRRLFVAKAERIDVAQLELELSRLPGRKVPAMRNLYLHDLEL